MQLMCHCDAYMDQALGMRPQVSVHHNGSRGKKLRALLVRDLHFAPRIAVQTDVSGSYERIRCTGES